MSHLITVEDTLDGTDRTTDGFFTTFVATFWTIGRGGGGAGGGAVITIGGGSGGGALWIICGIVGGPGGGLHKNQANKNNVHISASPRVETNNICHHSQSFANLTSGTFPKVGSSKSNKLSLSFELSIASEVAAESTNMQESTSMLSSQSDIYFYY